MTFNMLINVKMPTIVGILTFISMINTVYEHDKYSLCEFESKKSLYFFLHFSFYEQLEFQTSGPDLPTRQHHVNLTIFPL